MYFFREETPDEYIKRSLEEIKTDTVYKYIIKDVPSNILISTGEV